MKLIDLLQDSILNRKISEKIAGDLLKISSEQLFLRKKNLAISPAVCKKFKKAEKAIVERGLPYQYAVGKSWFYGREFIVNKDVLIPRIETELLVQKALSFLHDRIKNLELGIRNKKITIIDVGTGTGCLAVSLYKESRKFMIRNSQFTIQLYATDISEKALSVARKNSKIHKTKIIFLKSDLLDNPKLPQKFDLVLANLPYLPSADIIPENSIYNEPKIALNGGKDGLDLIEKLIRDLPNRLAKNGLAILEIDPRQKTEIGEYTKKYQLKTIFRNDLNNRTRFAMLENKR
ncbi:MAG: peptide chain release factor N(5)-glutamine methyltransferase [Candidatus Berkelbacteria bacterium]|nr:peptide chain release factor N(5)-glutamine methyltransferase [Candidatus Berkelbacteria bacterium]